MSRLILASASPRRKDLLERAGFTLDVHPSDVDESHRPGELVVEYVRRIARDKALAASQDVEWNGQIALLAADTTVWLDDAEPLGKPDGNSEAESMLMRLSGQTHRVTTAYCIVAAGLAGEAAGSVTTDVTMRKLDVETIRAYVATGEPFGKAGSYAIQGLASTFVRKIDGPWDNVVGLPVGEVIASLFSMSLLEHYPWAARR